MNLESDSAEVPLEYDFENSIGFWLLMASLDYQHAINEELAPQGVTYRQSQVLGLLALEGPLAQADLADRMGIEPPTLVGILDRMERDGWIRRVACPDDRRRKLIHPLKAAEPVWSKITASARRVRARATQGLSSEQLAELRELLALVRKNLKEPLEAQPPQ
jgi:MarR family transcriptional regulator, transcriptional regulator for hemolysin